MAGPEHLDLRHLPWAVLVHHSVEGPENLGLQSLLRWVVRARQPAAAAEAVEVVAHLVLRPLRYHLEVRAHRQQEAAVGVAARFQSRRIGISPGQNRPFHSSPFSSSFCPYPSCRTPWGLVVR